MTSLTALSPERRDVLAGAFLDVLVVADGAVGDEHGRCQDDLIDKRRSSSPAAAVQGRSPRRSAALAVRAWSFESCPSSQNVVPAAARA